MVSRKSKIHHLTLALKEKLEANIAKYEKDILYSTDRETWNYGDYREAKGKVEAIKETLKIFEELIKLH